MGSQSTLYISPFFTVSILLCQWLSKIRKTYSVVDSSQKTLKLLLGHVIMNQPKNNQFPSFSQDFLWS